MLYGGIQDVLRTQSYVYLRPTVTYEAAMGGSIQFVMAVALGYKAFDTDFALRDNSFDLQIDWMLTGPLTDKLGIAPSLHASWTNFKDRGLGEEYMIWAGFQVDLAL